MLRVLIPAKVLNRRKTQKKNQCLSYRLLPKDVNEEVIIHVPLKAKRSHTDKTISCGKDRMSRHRLNKDMPAYTHGSSNGSAVKWYYQDNMRYIPCYRRHAVHLVLQAVLRLNRGKVTSGSP